MRIREFQHADTEACIELLRSNIPEHFVDGDERLLRDFLAAPQGPYYVVERDGEIVACGGIAQERDDPRIATLCWGIVRNDLLRQGIGRQLTEHRIATFLPAHPEVEILQTNTSQKVQAFYERQGFVAVEVKRDAYGPGLDHVRMHRALR